MLLYDGSRILILAKTCKLGMAKMIDLRFILHLPILTEWP